MKQDFFEHFKKSKIMDKLSHAFLIETQNIDTFSEKLLFFLYEQNLLKTKSYFNNINLIIIETEEKEIKTEQIMYLQQRF
ncbi:MAG: hypothetical protein PHF21_04190, partial [Bacilli bacterium]|nr:hypothetical protein [Bacilli bacterium]